MEGKEVKNPPVALTVFELCKTFGCLPSELDQEDSKTIEEMIIIMNSISEHEKGESKATKRKNLAQTHGGAKRR